MHHIVLDKKYIVYYSTTAIRRAGRLLVTLAAVLVITGPTFAFYYEKRPVTRLALIVVFAVALAITLAITTNCKNQEIFAIIAALVCPYKHVMLLRLFIFTDFRLRYTAVMIVFVGNNPASGAKG
jgi:hypothetical protein